MSKDNTNAQKKEAYYGEHELNILEMGLKTEIAKNDINHPSSRQKEITAIMDKFKELGADNKKRYREFAKSYKKNRKTFNTFQSLRVRYQKQIIILNFIALFLFWANVKIGSATGGVSVFGFSLSGLEYCEVIIGFLFFLFVLHIRLTWVILSENFIFSKIYLIKRKAFRKEEIHFRRIFTLIKKLIFSLGHNHDDTNEVTETDAYVNFVYKRKESITMLAKLIFSWGCVLLTLTLFYMAFPFIQEQYKLITYLFLLSFLFLLWIELFPTPLTKLIKWKFNDLV